MEEDNVKKSKSKKILIIIISIIAIFLCCIIGILMANVENKDTSKRKSNKEEIDLESIELNKEVTLGRLTYYIDKNWKSVESIDDDSKNQYYYPTEDIIILIAEVKINCGNNINNILGEIELGLKSDKPELFISKDTKEINNNTYGVFKYNSDNGSQTVLYILANTDEMYWFSINQKKDKLNPEYIKIIENIILKSDVKEIYDTSVTDCDGIYKFVLNYSENYFTFGIVSFENGKCKIKTLDYNSISKSTTEPYICEFLGICGKNEEDNDIFYFTIPYASNETHRNFYCNYKFVKKDDNNLSYELISGSNLARRTDDKTLILTYVGPNEINFEDTFTQFCEEEKNSIEEQEKSRKEAEIAIEQARKEQEKADYKAKCQSYTYEQLARNPESVKGNYVKVTGEVIQAMYGTSSVELRVNITNNGYYYEDTIYATYAFETGENKILEGDIITIYGMASGEYTYTSVLGASITLPRISARYIDIN